MAFSFSIQFHISLTVRRYTYVYNCPQVLLFDSQSLVIVQFQARNREEIKSRRCRIDRCVIPRGMNAAIVNQCTMQYALYRLAWQGWVRLCTTLESGVDSSGELVRAQKPLSLGRCRREYVWYSGRPEFFDEYNHPCSVPGGYTRIFVHRPVERRNGSQKPGGFWVWTNGREMKDDTLNCFVW